MGIVKWVDIWGKPATFPTTKDPDPGNLGFIISIDPVYSGSTVNIGAVNRTIYVRVRNGGTISKVGLQVGTASGNIAVAAYTNSGTGRSAVPGARVATSGSVTCPTAGYAEVSLGGSVTLNAGDWLALAADNTTATFTAAAGAPVMVAALVAFQDVFPPPTTATSAGNGGRMMSLLGIP